MTDPLDGSSLETTGAIRLKVGVMGAAMGVVSREVLDKAHVLGHAIGTSGCVLITGACPGLPRCMRSQGGGRHGGRRLAGPQSISTSTARRLSFTTCWSSPAVG